MEASHLHAFDQIGDTASPVDTSSSKAASKSNNKIVKKEARNKDVVETEGNVDIATSQSNPKKTIDKIEPSSSVALPSGNDVDRSMKKPMVRNLNN